jgi:hypothetical protein
MKRCTQFRTGAVLSAIFLGLSAFAALPLRAQDSSSYGVTAQANQVTAGTRFLVGLQDTLSTENAKAGDHFKVRTLEPLRLANGSVLPPGMELTGHVDKVEAGHKSGHARLWLTFDEARTPRGRLPIVADVADVPGVHSIKVDYEHEGEIEMRNSNRQDQMRAAAAGAFVGAAPGVAAQNSKEAAAGAAAGAAAAFMVASGLGQELRLEKGTKLELILDRPLYLTRN